MVRDSDLRLGNALSMHRRCSSLAGTVVLKGHRGI
jgi:small subunit ribosomal protein S12